MIHDIVRFVKIVFIVLLVKIKNRIKNDKRFLAEKNEQYRFIQMVIIWYPEGSYRKSKCYGF